MMREKINELEVCYQKRDTRKYWNQLKQVGGWCRKGGGRIPDTAVDEKGEKYTGSLERFILPIGSGESR